MDKRSDFERKPKHFHPTPFVAVEPLIQHLPQGFAFAEPCAGDGQLCRHLEYFGGTCMWASDIEPQLEGILQNDYSEIGENEVLESQYIITNPPWDRSLIHLMIEHFTKLRPTWLLFDADWAHTKQSAPYIKNCAKIVSVASKEQTSHHSIAWYLFYNSEAKTTFYGRQ